MNFQFGSHIVPVISGVYTQKEALAVGWRILNRFPQYTTHLGEAETYESLRCYKESFAKKPVVEICDDINNTFGWCIASIMNIDRELAEIVAQIVCSHLKNIVFFDTSPDNERDPAQPKMRIYKMYLDTCFNRPHWLGLCENQSMHVLMGSTMYQLYRSTIGAKEPRAEERILCKQDTRSLTTSFRDYRWKTVGRAMVHFFMTEGILFKYLNFDTKHHIYEFL